jgi:hypothetical protein
VAVKEKVRVTGEAGDAAENRSANAQPKARNVFVITALLLQFVGL